MKQVDIYQHKPNRVQRCDKIETETSQDSLGVDKHRSRRGCGQPNNVDVPVDSAKPREP